MKRTSIVAFAIAVAVPAIAAAQPDAGGPSYTYADLGYLNLDVDGGGSIDGFGLRGSFAVNEQFHILAEYARVSDGPLSANTTTLAGGYSFPMAGTTDFVARLGFVNARAKAFGFSASDDGWMAQAGVRSMVTPQFELNAFLTHTDVGGSDTAIGVGAAYHFSNNFGVVGNVDYSDGDSLAFVGVRFSF